jgi:peptide/nickel transport system substrate-binding protein
VRLSFELLANQRNPIYGDIAQIIQADLRAVGVEVFPRLLEWQTVLSMHRSRDFDAVLTNWVLDNFRVDPRSLFHGSQVAIANSANRSSYSNPIADSLMDVGSRSTDDDVAKEVWAEFSRVLQADQPVTFLFWQDELAGVSHDLAGVVMDARGELVTLPRWRWANGGLP